MKISSYASIAKPNLLTSYYELPALAFHKSQLISIPALCVSCKGKKRYGPVIWIQSSVAGRTCSSTATDAYLSQGKRFNREWKQVDLASFYTHPVAVVRGGRGLWRRQGMAERGNRPTPAAGYLLPLPTLHPYHCPSYSTTHCTALAASVLLRAPSNLLQPILLLRHCHTNSARTIMCSAASWKPQTPLYQRPLAFQATLSELKKWYDWAKNQASSLGSTLVDLDKGPDSTLLLKELNWLVEDAIEHPSVLSPHHCGGNCDSAALVPIRACLDDLYVLWRQRIKERRPFQYVVGCEHWRDLVLSVEEGVLIPRPETEMIVDLVDEAVKGKEELRNGQWADLGTGSGALAIGVARVLGMGSSGCVIATDLSPVVVGVASYNVQRYKLEDKIQVRLGYWFEPLEDVEGELSGLVCNPPYIPSEDVNGLQAEVSKHEPRLALDGGSDGLNDLIHLCRGAASMLKPGGFFAFETNGEIHSKYLVKYLDTEMKGSFSSIKITTDFSGIQRFVSGYLAKE